MKRAVQNGVGQRRIKGKYLLVCIVGNDNKRRRLLSFLLPNGGKKERKKMKWAGREYESHLCIFSRSASNSLFLFPSLDVIKMIEIFLSRVGSIRIKQREKPGKKSTTKMVKTWLYVVPQALVFTYRPIRWEI
jgi:hypothetical protein